MRDFNLSHVATSIAAGSREMVGDVSLHKEDSRLVVTGWTRFNILENLSRSMSIVELKEIKEIYLEMIIQYPLFLQIAEVDNVKFVLDYDDGGGATGIVEECDGQINWIADLRA